MKKNLGIVIKVGKTYNVDHSSKGKFAMLVENVDDAWVGGTIVEGKADALLAYNVVRKGEHLNVRREFCQFSEYGK